MLNLNDIETPALILDQTRLAANCKRMTDRIAGLGARLRPHLKTAKSIDVARIALAGNFGGIAVATLNEAEYFAFHGIKDILYAVCISPDKLGRVTKILAGGTRLALLVDSPAIARQLNQPQPAGAPPVEVFIEIDSGEHRTGVTPEHADLLEIAAILSAGPHTRLRGILTHAGHSYDCLTAAQVHVVAQQERRVCIQAATRLRRGGFDCEEISIGSTPTAVHTSNLDGISEVRPGVYMMGDLFQAAISSCREEDIALSVLATVISHRRDENRFLLDAGALALSKDRSTAKTSRDQGYGKLIGLDASPLSGDFRITNVHQEHGEVSSSAAIDFSAFPIGSRVRVLPNHACMTAAMYDRYHVVAGESTEISAIWSRTNGWRPFEADGTRT